MSTCVGLAGRLFGHKFFKSKGGYTYRSDCCFRFGLRGGQPDD